jgi:hypothetical protein
MSEEIDHDTNDCPTQRKKKRKKMRWKDHRYDQGKNGTRSRMKSEHIHVDDDSS